jgi:hypothetical protein
VQVGEQKRALLALHALVTSPIAAPLLGLVLQQSLGTDGGRADKALPPTRPSATQQRSAAALAQKLLELLLQILEPATGAGADGAGQQQQQQTERNRARYKEVALMALQLAIALIPTWKAQVLAGGSDKEALLRWVSSSSKLVSHQTQFHSITTCTCMDPTLAGRCASCVAQRRWGLSKLRLCAAAQQQRSHGCWLLGFRSKTRTVL